MEEDGAWAWKSTLAKEREFKSGKLRVVDLPGLKRDWKFEPSARSGDNLGDLKKLNGIGELFGWINTGWEAYLKTDNAKLDTQIDTYIETHSDEWKKAVDSEGYFLNPATAADFCLQMTAESLTYANELVRTTKEGKLLSDDARKQKEAELDSRSVDEILDAGTGVCRHYALAAMGIYERLKARDKSGKLRNSFLVCATANGEDIANHEFNSLVAIGATETVISAADPTWFMSSDGRRNESFIEQRTGDLELLLNRPEVSELVGVEKTDWAGIFSERKKRLQEGVLLGETRIEEEFCNKYMVTELTRLRLADEADSPYNEELSRAVTQIIELIDSDKVRDKWGALESLITCRQVRESGLYYRQIAAILVARRAMNLENQVYGKWNEEAKESIWKNLYEFWKAGQPLESSKDRRTDSERQNSRELAKLAGRFRREVLKTDVAK